MVRQERAALIFIAAFAVFSLLILSVWNHRTTKLIQRSDGYFPAPGSSIPSTLGYTYNTAIYQSPGYTVVGYTGTPSYSSNTNVYSGYDYARPGQEQRNAEQHPALQNIAKQQALADSDAIMQSITNIVGPDGSVDGMYTLSLPPPTPVLPPSPPPVHRTPALMPRPTRLDWSYGGDRHGPRHWGSLKNWGLCATGQYQSPINLELNIKEEDNLNLLRWLSPTESYTARLYPPSRKNTFWLKDLKGSMKFRDEEYDLSHLIVHTPSEHRWQGKQYPMEIQFMHTRAGSDAVGLGVSVFLIPGTGDTPKALRPLMRGVNAYLATDIFAPGGVRITVPSAAHPAGTVPVPMNTARLMSDILGYGGNYANYLSYYGSETQPPCNEGVNWVVLKTPLPVRKEDYLSIARAQGYTARPTQEVHSRAVLDTATGQSFQTPQLPAQGF